MPKPRQITKHGSFFPPKQAQEFNFVNMGLEDSGFCSFAAVLIDRMLTHSPINADVLHKVLSRHYQKFSSQKELIETLGAFPKQQLDLSELLQSLAFTLRQIAVDELAKNPSRYLLTVDGPINLAEMRQPSIPVKVSAIAALAYALGLPLELKVKEFARDIWRWDHFNTKQKRANNLPVILQLENGIDYQPAVSSKFASLLARSRQAVELNVDPVPNDPSPEVIRQKIDEALNHLLSSFEETRKRLAYNIVPDEVVTSHIKSIGCRDITADREASHIGAEHGVQDLLKALKRFQSGKADQHDVAPQAEQDKQQLVLDTLAAKIIFGQVNEDEIYADVEDYNSGVSDKRLPK